MKRKIKINYKKERVLLSDVLPYEVPLTFSNRHFYNFVCDNSISLQEALDEKNEKFIKLSWKKCDSALDAIMSVIACQRYKPEEVKSEGNKNHIKLKKITTIPFSYRITHKDGDYRELSICHPLNQLSAVNFYHRECLIKLRDIFVLKINCITP